jgi:hypothetical protein
MEPTARALVRLAKYRDKDMADIPECVVCGKDLEPKRQHVDTCSDSHFNVLCEWQRRGIA